jgi:hypothetical protein
MKRKPQLILQKRKKETYEMKTPTHTQTHLKNYELKNPKHVLCRKLHQSVDLVPPVAVVGEALEVDDEILRQAPQVELLGGLLVFAAVRAVPGVLLAQLLCLSEQTQAVLQLKHRSLLGPSVPHRVMLLHVLQSKKKKKLKKTLLQRNL